MIAAALIGKKIKFIILIQKIIKNEINILKKMGVKIIYSKNNIIVEGRRKLKKLI